MKKKRQQQPIPPFILQYVKLLQHEVKYLKRIVNEWERTHTEIDHEENTEKYERYLIKKYLNYQCELYDVDQFKEGFEIKKVSYDENRILNIDTEKQIYQGTNLFQGAIWPIRFNSKFIGRISDLSLQEIYHILGYAYYLACGNISITSRKIRATGFIRQLQTKRLPMNRFFASKMFAQKNLFCHVGVQKIPISKNGIVKRFEFVSYMQFLDIFNEAFVVNKKKCQQRLSYFFDSIVNDIARKDHSDFLVVVPEQKKYYNKTSYLFQAQKNLYTDTWQFRSIDIEQYQKTLKQSPIFYPIKFMPYYVSNEDAINIKYDEEIKRWLTKEDLRQIQRSKYRQYQKQASSSILKRFIDFQSAKTLVELLTKIPNFKISLTQQQKDVIGQNGNVLAIGRSGTGKTTCAVLRLFSIEMLFKLRLSLYKKKELQNTETAKIVGSSDIDQTFGLHCIFLTASPVLTHEIQRYYKKLTDNIKSQLQKKKKRIDEQNKKKIEQKKNRQQKQKQQQDFEILQAPEKVIKSLSEEQIKEIQQKQINDELQDIQIKQDMQGFEQDEDIDEIKNKLQENVKLVNSLYDLKESDYPGFFTVKHFIMMIDGLLDKPFFIRKSIDMNENTTQTSWHNEKKGVMMIQNYHKGQQTQQKELNLQQIQEFNYSDQQELEHEYLRQIQLKQNKEKQNLTKKLMKNKIKNKLSFQVDYQFFLVNFWPTINKKYYSSKNITAHLVWTEIYSTIKGSAQSHQYPFQYLAQKAYVQSTSNSFLSHQEKLDIYECFCNYERWKISIGGYDIMDTVNYILASIRYNKGLIGPEIHYLMIDQIQDLPHAIVYLLSKTTSNYIFYSGDTAQTIAKGVGFRFCDLKSLFNPKIFNGSLQLTPPVLKHLTVNFRSHNNILQLANSIVSCLEILFPKTIDRLKKQISDLHGPKPILLSFGDEQLLFNVLSGVDEKTSQQNEGNLKKPALEFGCDQVIIVRNQQSKLRIPIMLQHALCLTIYQAKGLQFNDVILFNFFTESPCPQKWNLLKSLNVMNTQIPKEQYLSNLSRHNKKQEPKTQVQDQKTNEQAQKIQVSQIEQQVQFEQSFNKETNTYNVKKITSNLHGNFRDINDYAQLCSQLKLLYTAITRPKKTLIIYDEEESLSRNSIEKLWDKLNVVQIITKEFVLEELNKKSTNNEEVKLFKMIVSSDKSEWKKQGLKMYSRGYFDQAIKCFERSGQNQLSKKAYANKYADQATKKLIQIQSERNGIKQKNYQFQSMSNSQLAKYKKKLKLQQHQSLQKFSKSAQIFEQLLMFKQAGQCYFSGKLFQKAFECFCKAFMYRQAAQSLQMHNKYREAAEYYTKDNNYLKTIECLDMINQWQQILKKIQFFSNIMTQQQKTPLLKKYSALALEELVYQIQFENEQQQKRPENNMVEVIEQKQSQEEEYDSDQDPQLAAQRQYERKHSEQYSNSNPSRKQSEVQSIPSRKQSQIQEQHKLIQIKDSIYQKLQQEQQKVPKQQVSMSFSQLNASNAQGNNNEGLKSLEQSFGDLNKSQQPQILKNTSSNNDKLDIESLQSSFSQLNAKYDNELLPDLQSIKSLVDPDDLWVKNSISQIGNILQSQYSIIDSEQNYNSNMKIIKTKENIVVHDRIMKKIVNIVSIINDTVHQFFKNFKGYQSLITVDNNGEENNNNNDEVLDQFLEIDPKFLDIILDTLESFKLFKLCLFVCNRYNFPSKAGRYLISLGMKYSTNCISNNSVNPNLLAPSAYRKSQIQKGILASIAIHSIYQNVNPAFLKIKITQKQQSNKNNLGSYFIQGLILEGLYKKAVFMVDPQQSFKILANYNDYQAYNDLYCQKIKKQEENSSLKFLENKPSKKVDIQFTKILLKKTILDYCITSRRTEVISLRYYRQFQSNPENKIINKFKIDVPQYLPFAKNLIEHKDSIKSLVSNVKNIISNGYTILTKGNSLEVLDFVSSLLAFTLNNAIQLQIVSEFTTDEFLELYRCLNYVKHALKKIQGQNIVHIIDAVLSFYQCYCVKPCQSMIYLRDSYSFVHRTSIIANQLIENYKSNIDSFSFFFEQDYNLILSKTSKLLRIISKKFNYSLIQFYTLRVQQTIQIPLYFYEDVIQRQQQQILKKALRLQINQLMNRKNKVIKEKKKPKRPQFDYKNQLKMNMIITNEESDDDDQQQYNVSLKNKHYKIHTNPKLRYIAHHLVSDFNQNAKLAVEIVEGRSLYGCGMNNFYREYLIKKGGYNLFDALQFYKFKRVDLFAQNILSVFDNLTLYSRHQFLGQILILLLIQYKSIKEPKGFTLYMHTQNLKYFQNLKCTGSQSKIPHQSNPKGFELNQLITNNIQCQFQYVNDKVCEMNETQLSTLICDYLNLLLDEENSMFVDFSRIILTYALNVKNNKDISNHIKKIINTLGPDWKKISLKTLIGIESLQQYQEKRSNLLVVIRELNQPVHAIRVSNQGNLNQAITESERDYQIEGRIIEGRKRAVNKIIKWWRQKKSEAKIKNIKGNYFQHKLALSSIKQNERIEVIGNIRLMKTIYKGKDILSQVDTLYKIQKARDELLSFYLINTIASSLDLHFILKTLNKLEEHRKMFFQYCSRDNKEITELNIEDIKNHINVVVQTIKTWKNDGKWLKQKNFALKKKKVFEVKWMTKNIGYSNMLKKRANLKKQQKLQQKKRFIKKIK